MQYKPVTKLPTFPSFHLLTHALHFIIYIHIFIHTFQGGENRMKDRIERFVVLPFSLGCSTQSSVAVAVTGKKPNQLIKRREERDEKESFRKEETKLEENNGANISDGVYKIIRSFKSFSHFFIRYEEEREERDTMEIGYPTDVKHLSHIGVDGTMTTFDVCSSPSSSFPFPSFHLTAV